MFESTSGSDGIVRWGPDSQVSTWPNVLPPVVVHVFTQTCICLLDCLSQLQAHTVLHSKLIGPARAADVHHVMAAPAFGCLVHELHTGYMSCLCTS